MLAALFASAGASLHFHRPSEAGGAWVSLINVFLLTICTQVPVFEYNISGNHVMRRRADDWINATHILKVADFDKPARTRILEREVQKGVHEKVQGGYGKYQGETARNNLKGAVAEPSSI
jgi:hypothetical protein